jgi:phage gp45-like
MDYTVLDSSQQGNSWSFASLWRRDSSIKLGQIRSEYIDSFGQTRYKVEVFTGGNTVIANCALMTRFGGVQNYEEYRLRPYNAVSTTDVATNSAYMSSGVKAGDQVIVAFLQGHNSEGLILGGLHHPGRKEVTKLGELAYASEFNGIEQTISNKGAYRVTFKAPITTNLDTHVPGKPIPAQQLNTKISGTYYELDHEGSWTVNDNKSQFIKVNKTKTEVNITSGDISISLSGANKLLSVKTADFKLTADKSVAIKAPKIAIGGNGFELFDSLIKLIDILGTLVVTSPVGTCTPLKTAPTWAQIEQIKTMISNIKGNL